MTTHRASAVVPRLARGWLFLAIASCGGNVVYDGEPISSGEGGTSTVERDALEKVCHERCTLCGTLGYPTVEACAVGCASFTPECREYVTRYNQCLVDHECHGCSELVDATSPCRPTNQGDHR